MTWSVVVGFVVSKCQRRNAQDDAGEGGRYGKRTMEGERERRGQSRKSERAKGGPKEGEGIREGQRSGEET